MPKFSLYNLGALGINVDTDPVHGADGQLTKAQNAIARMQRAQSKPAFLDAATEFQGIISKGVENARRKAGADPSASQPKRIRVDAQGNIIGN